MKNLAAILILFFISFTTNAQLVVTNTNDAGPGSLRDAIMVAVNGQSIHFDPGLITSGSAAILLNSQITFSKSITIVGLYNEQDTLYISGGNLNRIFSISNTTNVFLDSLVIINGYSGTTGGAVSFVNSDSLIVNNSQLFNNHAGQNGGGIYMFSTDSVSLLLENTIISNNTSVENGGGIYIQNTNSGSEAFCSVKANNCLFHLNYAGMTGGGLYAGTFSSAFDDSKILIDITNSVISANSANAGGGVGTDADANFNSFPTCAGYSEINLTNCLIQENSANNGGGIRSHASTINHDLDTAKINAENCVVSNNVAYEGAGLSCYGYVSVLTFSNSKAISNFVYESGGALYCRPHPFTSGTSESYSIVTIFNSTLSDNSAVTSGGALYSAPNALDYDNKTNSNIYIDRSTFNNNESAEGGAIFSEGAANMLEMNESTFTGNYAGEGGAVHSISHSNYTDSGVEIYCNNSTIYGNSSQYSAGALYAVATVFGFGSHIYPKSSIIAFNGANQIDNSNASTVESAGYNIFSDAIVAGSAGTDQLNVDSLGLNLYPLNFYGGVTKTLMPGSSSVAINSGDPLSLVAAQNVPVVGTREVGAAETCQTTYSIDFLATCDSLVWIDGNTYYAPNASATDTLVNAAGCDSIVTLNLALLKNAGVDVHYVCDSLVWIDGNTYYANNNTATFNLVGANVYGCDSLVTLDLVVMDGASHTDVIVTCAPFTWIDGNTYFSNNNSAFFTFSGGAANGCDSTVYLDLVLLNDSVVDVQSACDSTTWLDGATYYSDNNAASYLMTNQFGCDSLIFLDLKINYSVSTIDNVTNCGPYTWINGTTYFTDNSSATYLMTTIHGCDSLVSLNLVVDTIDNSITQNGLSLISNAVGVDYQWLDCNNSYAIVTGAVNQTFDAVVNGNYAVMVSANSCVDTSDCLLIDFVDSDEPGQDQMEIYIGPNPTSGVVVIQYGEYAEVFVQVYNSAGEIVSEIVEESSVTFIKIELPAAKGIYLVRVRVGDEWKDFKVVKE